MKRLTIFVALIVTVIGFACSPFTASSQPKPAPAEPVPGTTQETAVSQPATLPAPTETPIPGPSFHATTYRDEAAGFEFDYPADWAFDPGEQQSRGRYVQFYSWGWQPGDPVEPLPAGATVLSVTVQLWDPKNDLQAFIDQRKLAWDASGFSLLSEERLVLAGERPAAQFTVQGADGSPAYFLFTTNGENYLVLSGSGDLSLLKEIAQTLRPVQ